MMNETKNTNETAINQETGTMTENTRIGKRIRNLTKYLTLAYGKDERIKASRMAGKNALDKMKNECGQDGYNTALRRHYLTELIAMTKALQVLKGYKRA